MKEASVYEAACEVRDQLRDASDYLGGELQALAAAVGLASSRRDRWAGELFARLALRALETSVPITGKHIETGRELAARAWELADALDAADPRRKVTAGVTPAAGDDGEGIDLAAALPPVDPDPPYRPWK